MLFHLQFVNCKVLFVSFTNVYWAHNNNKKTTGLDVWIYKSVETGKKMNSGWSYLDRLPGSLHKIFPLLKFIITQSELPWIWLHDAWTSQGPTNKTAQSVLHLLQEWYMVLNANLVENFTNAKIAPKSDVAADSYMNVQVTTV